MKVSYKGVTGELISLEREGGFITDYALSMSSTSVCFGNATPTYTLKIQEDYGHIHVFTGIYFGEVTFQSAGSTASEDGDYWKEKYEALVKKIKALKETMEI